MDKAPDAFRTISEVAADLDIPQHVLRFWETRFAQIKPMKRSGGRRYYRPDDVDLLRGIRRLLYGEGYTIRGVQRILKEHGIELGPASGGRIGGRLVRRDRGGDRAKHSGTRMTSAAPGIDVDDDDYEGADGIDFRLLEGRRGRNPRRRSTAARSPASPAAARPLDVARLEGVLQDLIACRQLLDQALKDG